MLIALTRPVSSTLGQCELTHLAREPIDVARAMVEHRSYEDTLATLGATIVRVPGDSSLPDAVFIEDTALVLDQAAVVTRPGASSRRPETQSVAEVLARYRPLLRVEPPATLDGGDVLPIDRTIYVGLSTRTNLAGATQLGTLLRPLGYEVVSIKFTGCLHLKSAATRVGPSRVLLNPRWILPTVFRGLDCLEVHPEEPAGANALLLGGSVVYPSHFPRTADRLATLGLRVHPVDTRELAKAEGGVTCCSLIFQEAASAA